MAIRSCIQYHDLLGADLFFNFLSKMVVWSVTVGRGGHWAHILGRGGHWAAYSVGRGGHLKFFLCFVETKEQSWADATTAATQQLFSGQEVLAYSIMALFVVATPFRHRGIDTFFFYFVCHGSSNMLSRCLLSRS